MARRKPETLRNLLRRLPAPARRNGRLQKACYRALWGLGEASTTEINQWSHALRVHRGERIREGDTWATRRALASIGATRTGRATTRGRPWIWALKDEISSDNANENNG